MIENERDGVDDMDTLRKKEMNHVSSSEGNKLT
jgi:hypothetical protein